MEDESVRGEEGFRLVSRPLSHGDQLVGAHIDRQDAVPGKEPPHLFQHRLGGDPAACFGDVWDHHCLHIAAALPDPLQRPAGARSNLFSDGGKQGRQVAVNGDPGRIGGIIGPGGRHADHGDLDLPRLEELHTVQPNGQDKVRLLDKAVNGGVGVDPESAGEQRMVLRDAALGLGSHRHGYAQVFGCGNECGAGVGEGDALTGHDDRRLRRAQGLDHAGEVCFCLGLRCDAVAATDLLYGHVAKMGQLLVGL